MLLRREVVKSVAGLFGLGAGTPSRFPYEDRPQPAPGLGPSQGQNVRARVVIVTGPTGSVSGVFVYSPGTIPALGNPPIASMTAGTKDPFGNTVIPQITAYGAGGSTVRMTAGTSTATLLVGTGDAAETSIAAFSSTIAGAGATRQLEATLLGPSTSTPGTRGRIEIDIASGSVDQTLQPFLDLVARSNDGATTLDIFLSPTVFAVGAIITATIANLTFSVPLITLTNGAGTSTIGINSANGHPVFSEEIELAETAAPGTPGSGIKMYSDTLGIPRAIGEDGSILALGTRSIMFTGTQLISVNGFTTLNDGTNNLSSNVSTGRKYKIRARVIYQATSGTVGSPAFTVTTPASSGGLVYDFDYNGNASGVCRYDNTSGFGSSEGGPAHATAGAATFVTLDITGTASFTATGTVAVRASINGAGNSTFTIQQGSFIEVSPI